ncbi:MAG TPA: class II fructose-bisphosphatase [Myxococcales bacterium LLY-WYZ-16_1]|jgi:fructose-1,6-bisphosphatase II|nr:class II fructose-bisphosphatase [Myxococcales bacterium LLY-WYZ-16_1]
MVMTREPAEERNLALDAVRVTESAAIASARWMGLGDLHGASDSATRAMRAAFDSLEIAGNVVIGEGEQEEAPLLYVGEKVGRWQGDDPRIDVAVDPLEGVRMCALGQPNALSVLAMTRRGHFLKAPDMYMDKIAVGPAGKGAVDITQSATWNLHAVADAKGVYVQDLTVCVLDRPRHEGLIREIREAGARIKLIPDGDVAAAIATCREEESGIDLLMGTGGAPEGVMAAAALRCVGGDMVGRLRPRSQDEMERAVRAGIDSPGDYLKLDDLVSGEILFAATGITDGDLLKGVRFRRGGAVTQSCVMRSKTRTLRLVEAHHRFDQRPNFGEL